MRSALIPASGWTVSKYFSISKLMPSPAVRQTGWDFSWAEGRTSWTASPRVSFTKAKTSLWASAASLAFSWASSPAAPLMAERKGFSW